MQKNGEVSLIVGMEIPEILDEMTEVDLQKSRNGCMFLIFRTKSNKSEVQWPKKKKRNTEV